MVSLQKESEWEKELTPKIVDILSYQASITSQGDRYTGEKDWALNKILALVSTVVSKREKEIAEEVKKKRKEPTHSGTGSISWYNQALDEVLLIMKK